MNDQEKARELGYEVGLAFETLEGDKTFTVKGFGVDTMYPESDKDMWKWLVNEDAHKHRVDMYRHNLPSVEEAKKAGVPEDMIEKVADDFTMTDEEILESSLNASISAGLITKESAEEIRKSRATVASR